MRQKMSASARHELRLRTVVRYRQATWKDRGRILKEFVAAMERFGHLELSDDVRQHLLAMSAATMDRLLYTERHPNGRGISTTRPGQLLKSQIPVRTFADWNEVTPGFMEADLVAHCGDNASGSFLYTLTLTDIATGWTECVGLLHRTEADVTGALRQVRQALPFPLLGLDTDNGGEFINYEMLRCCQREQITFTRARTYKKNDQAHVEQKNGSVVRRLVGYDRCEGGEAWRALSGLYRVLRLYVNFFQPSLKLAAKKRDGAHVTKRYERARTPYQRLVASAAMSEAQKDRLRAGYEQLDPVALLAELQGLSGSTRGKSLPLRALPRRTCRTPTRSRKESLPPIGNPFRRKKMWPRSRACTGAPRRSRWPIRGGRARIRSSRSGASSACSSKSIRTRRPSSSSRACRSVIRGRFLRGSCARCSGGCGNGAGSISIRKRRCATRSSPTYSRRRRYR